MSIILDKAIENLQSNMKIVVYNQSQKEIFSGTIGELSAKYTTLGRLEINYHPFFNNALCGYQVEVSDKK